MRAGMTAEEVRAAGVYLNGGRRRGWRRHLAHLLGTPETTVSTWATRTRSNARPIPGVAVVAIKLLVAMYRQELAAGPDVAGVAARFAERVAEITRQPEMFPQQGVPLQVPTPLPPPIVSPPIVPAVLKAEVRGAQRKARRGERPGLATAETPPPGDPVLFGVTRRRRGPRKPT